MKIEKSSYNKTLIAKRNPVSQAFYVQGFPARVQHRRRRANAGSIFVSQKWLNTLFIVQGYVSHLSKDNCPIQFPLKIRSIKILNKHDQMETGSTKLNPIEFMQIKVTRCVVSLILKEVKPTEQSSDQTTREFAFPRRCNIRRRKLGSQIMFSKEN